MSLSIKVQDAPRHRPDVDTVRAKAEKARAAALRLQASTNEERAAAVLALADAIERAAPAIFAANAEDLADAQRAKLAAPLLSRLQLTPEKLKLTLEGVRSLARAEDPIGRTLRATLLDDGLRLYQIAVPIGVIACVFESRPDAAIQIPALTLRSGNAALLKGGREAERTNRAIVDTIRRALTPPHGVDRSRPDGSDGVEATRGVLFEPAAVQLLDGRAEVEAVLALDGLVDLVIPRGGAAFVRHVMDSTRIPVLGHAEGVCHVYVDKAADLAKALPLVVDAKTDNPSACNAAECILIDRDAAPHYEREVREALAKAGVEVREDEQAYGVEFGDMTVALAIVEGVEGAAQFVNRHGSRHTDVIVTEDPAAARRFIAAVDSAGVFVNASPRFADGYRYGLGAEVGVSTSKVHARGPVGMEGLTTTKWVLLGEGHTAGRYQGKVPRPFKHAPLGRGLAEEWE